MTVMKYKCNRRLSMKEIIGWGILLVLAGCSTAVSTGRSADLSADGWYSRTKTELQHSKDAEECRTLCKSS